MLQYKFFTWKKFGGEKNRDTVRFGFKQQNRERIEREERERTYEKDERDKKEFGGRDSGKKE